MPQITKQTLIRLWDEFFKVPFPKELHDDKYPVDLALIDASVGGCISSFINKGNLDAHRKNILEDFVKNYENTCRDFSSSGREYFDKLKAMAVLVLETIKIDKTKSND